MASDAPTVVSVDHSGSQPSQPIGTLFKGIKFFILQRVPARSTFCNQVIANGGAVVKLEKLADILIADHARSGQPDGSVSYRWIEACLRERQLVDKAAHEIPPEKQQRNRPVGAVVPSTRAGTRVPFTKEDDEFCYNFVQKKLSTGAKELGNAIYQELEQLRPNHPFQSWRSRYISYVRNNPPTETAQTQTLPFTAEDDEFCWKFVQQKLAENSRYTESGYEVYRALEQARPSHTFQSWHDRYTSHIKNNPPAARNQVTPMSAADKSGTSRATPTTRPGVELSQSLNQNTERVKSESWQTASHQLSREDSSRHSEQHLDNQQSRSVSQNEEFPSTTPSRTAFPPRVKAELARRVSANSDLKRLVRLVAARKASREELSSYEVHLNDVEATVAARRQRRENRDQTSPRTSPRKGRTIKAEDQDDVKVEEHASTAQAVLDTSPMRPQNLVMAENEVLDDKPEPIQDVDESAPVGGDAVEVNRPSGAADRSPNRPQAGILRKDNATSTPVPEVSDTRQVSRPETEVKGLADFQHYVRSGSEEFTFAKADFAWLLMDTESILKKLNAGDQEAVWIELAHSWALDHPKDIAPSPDLWKVFFDAIYAEPLERTRRIHRKRASLNEEEQVAFASPQGLTRKQLQSVDERELRPVEPDARESSPLAGKSAVATQQTSTTAAGETGAKPNEAEQATPRKRARFADPANTSPDRDLPQKAKRGRFLIRRSEQKYDNTDPMAEPQQTSSVLSDTAPASNGNIEGHQADATKPAENEITIWQGEQFNVEDQENAHGSPDRQERRSGQPEQRMAVFTGNPDVSFKLEPTTIADDEFESLPDEDDPLQNGHEPGATARPDLLGAQADGNADQLAQAAVLPEETQFQDALSQISSQDDDDVASGQRHETPYQDAPSYQDEADKAEDQTPQKEMTPAEKIRVQFGTPKSKEVDWTNGMLAEVDTQALLYDYGTPPPDLQILEPSPIRNFTRRSRHTPPRSPEPAVVFDDSVNDEGDAAQADGPRPLVAPPSSASPSRVGRRQHPTRRDDQSSSPEAFAPPLIEPNTPRSARARRRLIEPGSPSPELPVVEEIIEVSERGSAPPQASQQDEVEAFIEEQTRLGRTEDEAELVLNATMDNTVIARTVLSRMAIGGELPVDISGCWTDEDDAKLLDGSPASEAELVAYHGAHSVSQRRTWLNQV